MGRGPPRICVHAPGSFSPAAWTQKFRSVGSSTISGFPNAQLTTFSAERKFTLKVSLPCDFQVGDSGLPGSVWVGSANARPGEWRYRLQTYPHDFPMDLRWNPAVDYSYAVRIGGRRFCFRSVPRAWVVNAAHRLLQPQHH